MICLHNRYRQKDYMLLDNAKKAMRKGDICWMGITVKNCAECGEDISFAKRVQVKTAEQYLRGLG